MAIRYTLNEKKKLVPHYYINFNGDLDWNPHAYAKLQTLRKESINAQEICRGVYKDGLRLFQRQEKAITILMRWLEGNVSDLRTHTWPVELAQELDNAVIAYKIASRLAA